MGIKLEAVTLKREDVEKLKQRMDRLEKLVINLSGSRELAQPNRAPDTYVFEVPEGGVPGRVNDEVGSALCKLARLDAATDSPDGQFLVSLIEDPPATYAEHRVFNLDIEAIPYDSSNPSYFIGWRDKFGRYLTKPSSAGSSVKWGITTAVMNQGASCSVDEIALNASNVLIYTGTTYTVWDMIMNLGESIPAGVKITFGQNPGGQWSWITAYCKITNTAPEE